MNEHDDESAEKAEETRVETPVSAELPAEVVQPVKRKTGRPKKAQAEDVRTPDAHVEGAEFDDAEPEDVPAPTFVAAPEPKPATRGDLLHVLEIPPGLDAIPLNDAQTMPADVRLALQSQLGCLFAMKDGALTTADGRHMQVVVADVIEVFER